MEPEEEFRAKLSELVADAMATNDALTDGVAKLLVGRTVTAASAEVWSSDGEWSIKLEFDDGSRVEVPGVTYATGPLAELIRMAGGQPEYVED